MNSEPLLYVQSESMLKTIPAGYSLVMERISNYSHFRPLFDYFRAIRIRLLGIRYITLLLVK